MPKIKNPIAFSEHFGIDPLYLHKAEALDPILNIDTKLFIDPQLLAQSRPPEMKKGADSRLRNFFGEIIKLLGASQTVGDAVWRNVEMNWNNTQFDNGLPITIKVARQVGGILKYAGDLPEIEASYSYYM